jgi:hypothetical protein
VPPLTVTLAWTWDAERKTFAETPSAGFSLNPTNKNLQGEGWRFQ